MASIAEQVCAQLDHRLRAAEGVVAADKGASPVLAGVLAEFRRKFAKTRLAVEGDPGPGQREAVVELEQAADSTKWAALADTGASDKTKLAAISAHDSICWYKATGDFLEPIREVWVPDQGVVERRRSMSRIMARRTKAAALRAWRS
jgi:hypothetical protein